MLALALQWKILASNEKGRFVNLENYWDLPLSLSPGARHLTPGYSRGTFPVGNAIYVSLDEAESAACLTN